MHFFAYTAYYWKSDKKRIIIKNYLISVTCDESAGSQLEIKIISEPLKNLAHQKK